MDTWINYYPAILCWAVPLFGSVLTPIVSKIGNRCRDLYAVSLSAAASLFAFMMIPWLTSEPLPIDLRFPWLELPSSPIGSLQMGVLIDPLSIIIANVVAPVSLLIMIYSIKYMEGDPSMTRYWFFMNLFIGNMLLLSLSDNFIQMMFGWEGVGLCSYALIGFWNRDSKGDWLKSWVGEGREAYPPSHAGMKAFVMTRFGDVVMLLGIFLLSLALGSVNFLEMQEGVRTIPGSLGYLLLPAALLIFFGAVGKSAQLPLMEWLPDAMAGPSPVSALIHAATMVKAGVYLIARIFPIFYIAMMHSAEIIYFFQAVAWIGAITSFVAATEALASTELKKVLAYSTVSQIGYMMLAMGVAGTAAEFYLGYTGGLMHLMSHAVFKASLFLAAGAVIHAAKSRFFIDMGGMRKKMPITFASTLLASLSLMGVPLLFGGFWSKDLILESALLSGTPALFIIGVATVALTGFYTVRMLGLVFYGDPRDCSGGIDAPTRLKDPSRSMWIPFLILASITVVLGIFGYSEKAWLASTIAEYYGNVLGLVGEALDEGLATQLITGLASASCLLVGAIPAYLIYVKRQSIRLSPSLFGRIAILLKKRYYINIAYYSLFVDPLIKASGWLEINLERGVFNNANEGIAKMTGALAQRLRRVQTGDLNINVLMMLVGMGILALMIIIISLW